MDTCSIYSGPGFHMANLYSLFKSRFGEFCAREAIRFDNSDDNRVSLTYESLDVLVNRTSEALGCPVASNEVTSDLYLRFLC